MATTLVQPLFPSSLVNPLTTNKIRRRTHRVISATHHMIRKGRFCGHDCPFGSMPIYIARVGEQNSGLVEEDTLTHFKTQLHQALKGINRGIFGAPYEKKSEIEELVKQLESLNPTPDPTLNLEKVVGCWKLVYSTITILGSKRTKLGLRDFISLGDFFQTIDVSKLSGFGYGYLVQPPIKVSPFYVIQQYESKAVNVIKFSVRGFKFLDGQLTIEASFKRVNISYDNSTITPDQLMNIFRKNYDLLLSIFNPEGWLEITYVDDTTRIGRDDTGNIFILERISEEL